MNFTLAGLAVRHFELDLPGQADADISSLIPVCRDSWSDGPAAIRTSLRCGASLGAVANSLRMYVFRFRSAGGDFNLRKIGDCSILRKAVVRFRLEPLAHSEY